MSEQARACGECQTLNRFGLDVIQRIEGHWHYCALPPPEEFFIQALIRFPGPHRVQIPLKTTDYGELWVIPHGFHRKELSFPSYTRSGFVFIGDIARPGKLGSHSIVGWCETTGYRDVLGYRLFQKEI
jgi:hypothetical protein